MRTSVGAFFLASAIAAAVPAYAQYNGTREGVQSFQQGKDAWRRQDDSKITVLPKMVDSIGKAAAENVTGAEQVFCYQVTNRPADYSGYTLNGMAVTGFCGVINQELRDILVNQLFANAANVDFNTSEQCVIRPKLMLRFVRGVDFTDVLVSAPCYSIAVFYGGKVKTYNFNPGKEMLDVMVDSFEKQSREFVSPSLLNQLLPIGVAQTVEQQRIVRTHSQPVREWEKAKPAASAPAASSTASAPKASGWNKVKVNVK